MLYQKIDKKHSEQQLTLTFKSSCFNLPNTINHCTCQHTAVHKMHSQTPEKKLSSDTKQEDMFQYNPLHSPSLPHS